MLIHRNALILEQREKMRGGEGTAKVTHFAPYETLRKGIKLFAEITLPPGASVGRHKHETDIEYVTVVSGSGTLKENGKEYPLKVGDSNIAGNGSEHEIINSGARNLVVHSLVME
ncbi:oxalate-binding protein [Spirochaetia bacterium]|nr:oxalate-binding protein [Spirochaetia bacterium]